MTYTFIPYLAGEVNSNIDIQLILDEYSYAEYVNKSARGGVTYVVSLPRWYNYTGQLKALSLQLLKAVEISVVEAAWYLLRQLMGGASRQIVHNPTVWPTERQCCRDMKNDLHL